MPSKRVMPDIERGLNRLPPLESRYLSRLPTIAGFVGSTGSGKTYLCLQLLSLLRREGALDNIYLISPTALSNVLYKSVMREGVDSTFTEPNSNKVFDYLKEVEKDVMAQSDRWRDELEYSVALQKHEAGEGLAPGEAQLLERYGFRRVTPKRPRCALVIDDCQGSQLFSNSPRNYLSQLVLRCRHVGGGVGLSIFLVAQTSRGIPRPLRLQFTHLFLYSTASKREQDILYDESGSFMTRDEWGALFRMYTETSKYSYMYCDLYSRAIKDSI
jgi:hypothetical protein